MDFDDFFKKKNKHHKKQAMYRYPQGNSYKSYAGSHAKFNPLAFINSLRNNRKLKIVFLIVLIIIIAFIIGLIAILVPLITRIFNYMSENGFSGVFNKVVSLVDKLWNGAK